MSDRAISEAIRILSGDPGTNPVFSLDAIVKTVNEKARTCVVTLVTGKIQNEIPDVRLMAVVDDGFLLVPAVDSNVVVILSSQSDPYVSAYGEIEKIIMRGGDLGGLVKIKEAVKRYNKIEDDVNKLKQAFTTWTPVPNDGGAALKAAAASWSGQQLTKTVDADIENDKITQG